MGAVVAVGGADIGAVVAVDAGGELAHAARSEISNTTKINKDLLWGELSLNISTL